MQSLHSLQAYRAAKKCCEFSTVEIAHHSATGMVEWPIFAIPRAGIGSIEQRTTAGRKSINGNSFSGTETQA
jgi:hypothetical protein